MLILLIEGVITLFVIGVTAGLLGNRLKHPIALIVNLLLLGSLFALGWAMNTEPEVPSGNGNLALLLLIPIVGLGFVLLYQLYTRPLLRRMSPLALGVILLGLVAHQAAGFDLQNARYRHLRERIADFYQKPIQAWEVEVLASGWESTHMNGHFFHLNTYWLFIGWIAIIAVIGLLIEMRLRRRKKQDKINK